MQRARPGRVNPLDTRWQEAIGSFGFWVQGLGFRVRQEANKVFVAMVSGIAFEQGRTDAKSEISTFGRKS